MELRTDLQDREQTCDYIQATFQEYYTGHPTCVEDAPGGRIQALKQLEAFKPQRYTQRNYVSDAVSFLSPYMRHGMVTPKEVRDFLIERHGSPAQNKGLEEFLRQLTWREFFYLAYAYYDQTIWEGIEEPKVRTQFQAPEELPEDIAAATTGLPCMDGMLETLFSTGYLHNHERLWLAAYVCHFRGISWLAGYRLFREYLLDGDIASNALSWQWVSSHFSQKPYIFNKENLNKYTSGHWCRTCRVPCPFNESYESLNADLFGL
jgi:deoxyribodipyrimidine photo-lyase